MTNTDFETQHPREATGKFDTKDQSAPEVSLSTLNNRIAALTEIGVIRGRFNTRDLDDTEFDELTEHLAGSIEIWAPYVEGTPSEKVTVSYPEFYSSDGIYNIARVLNPEKTATSWTIYHTGNIYPIPDVVAKSINFNDMTHDRVRDAEQRLEDYALYGSVVEGLPSKLADARVALEKSRIAQAKAEDSYQVEVLSSIAAYADENWPDSGFDKAVFKVSQGFVRTYTSFVGFERDGDLAYIADDTDEATTHIKRLTAEITDPSSDEGHLDYVEDYNGGDDKYTINLSDYR